MTRFHTTKASKIAKELTPREPQRRSRTDHQEPFLNRPQSQPFMKPMPPSFASKPPASISNKPASRQDSICTAPLLKGPTGLDQPSFPNMAKQAQQRDQGHTSLPIPSKPDSSNSQPSSLFALRVGLAGTAPCTAPFAKQQEPHSSHSTLHSTFARPRHRALQQPAQHPALHLLS